METNSINEDIKPNSERSETPDLLLLTRVRAMLENEAYHYCADCHSHCRQTILAAEATKEAGQAYDRLNNQHTKLVETPCKCRMEIDALTQLQICTNDVDRLNGLPSRFPTHRSVERLRRLLTKIAEASTYDPGETDLDDEQPITLTVDLGDVRMARRLLR